jgi:hypothetical protein
MKTTIDDITPVKDYLICTKVFIDQKKSVIELSADAKEKLEQPALKIRRIHKDSKYKVGQVFLVASGSLNATAIKINDIIYWITPEFEARATVDNA